MSKDAIIRERVAQRLVLSHQRLALIVGLGPRLSGTGEMIVFRDLLDKAPTREDRLALLLSKIDDIVNSVVRQCSFDQFEQQVGCGGKLTSLHAIVPDSCV